MGLGGIGSSSFWSPLGPSVLSIPHRREHQPNMPSLSPSRRYNRPSFWVSRNNGCATRNLKLWRYHQVSLPPSLIWHLLSLGSRHFLQSKICNASIIGDGKLIKLGRFGMEHGIWVKMRSKFETRSILSFLSTRGEGGDMVLYISTPWVGSNSVGCHMY